MQRIGMCLVFYIKYNIIIENFNNVLLLAYHLFCFQKVKLIVKFYIY
jgi:hypothetical protein